MGFIQYNGTACMSLYLTPLAYIPGTAPSPLVQLGGISYYGQRAAPLAATYDLGGTLCVPGESALRAPAPHETTFTGPRLGGIPYGQQVAPLAAIYDLGGDLVCPWGECPAQPCPP